MSDSFTQYIYKQPGLTHQLTTSKPPHPTLEERFRARPPRPEELLSVLVELGLILAALHEQGRILRELRPEELWCSGDGLWVGGLSRALSRGQPGPPMSTGYGRIAPEQINTDAPLFEPRSDLFSFGVLLYEQLTGRLPFTGRNPAAVMLATLESTPPPPSQLNPACPPSLDALCLSLLEKLPADRPESAMRLVERLQQIIDEPAEETLASDAALRQVSATPERAPSEGSPRYEVNQEIARGGMGRISRARDKHLGREVALKELLAKQGATRQRFLREAKLTARLQHPAIVPIYEVGEWPSGELFYTMKIVSGSPLEQSIKQTKSLQERLALLPAMIDVCDAIAYAHTEKIIHRDLKPANIMLGAFGETIVIDWGLAKDLREAPSAEPNDAYRAQPEQGAGLTSAGSIMGTPAYMPPEQARGASVDERADVYSLGAILYHLLAGDLPYRAQSAQKLLLQLVEGPPPPLQSRQPGVPQDLLAIVNKAMARDPQERYPSAKELAVDLKKFQTGQLVGAHQYSLGELLRKWLRRHRSAVIVGSLLTLALIALSMISYNNLATQRKTIIEREAQAQEERTKAEALLAASFEEQGRQELLAGEPTRALPLLLEAYRLQGSATTSALRHLLQRATNNAEALTESFHAASPAVMFALSPDGSLLASAGEEGGITLWQLNPKKQLEVLPSAPLTALQFTPEGDLLFADNQKHLTRWSRSGQQATTLSANAEELFSFASCQAARLSDQRLLFWRQAPLDTPTLSFEQVSGAALSPDCSLLSASHNNGWRLIDLTQNKLIRETPRGVGEEYDLMIFSPDSTMLMMTDANGEAKISAVRGDAITAASLVITNPEGNGPSQSIGWHTAEEGEGLFTSQVSIGASRAYPGFFSPDNTMYMTSAAEGTPKLWSAEPMDFAARDSNLLFQLGEYIDVAHAFSTDSALVATSEERVAHLWSTKTGQRLFSTPALPSPIVDVQFSPDSQSLFTLSGGDVTRWSTRATARVNSFRASGSTLSADGRSLALWMPQEGVRWLDLETAQTQELKLAKDISVMRLSPHGELLALAEGEQLLLWERSKEPRKLKAEGRLSALQFSFDGRYLAGASAHALQVWEAATGEEVMRQQLSSPLRDIAASPTQLLFAYATRDALVFVDLKTKAMRESPLPASDLFELRRIRFSQDGARLVVPVFEEGVWIFDTLPGGSTERVPSQLQAHSADLSPDGSMLVVCDSKGMAEIRRLRWGKNRLTSLVVGSPYGYVGQVRFSAAGLILVASSEGSSVRDDAGRLLMELEPTTELLLSSDGRRAVTGSISPDIGLVGRVTVWSLEEERRRHGELVDLLKTNPWALDGGRLVRR